MIGPQKIPFAVTVGSSWYGDSYAGTPFEANVGVLHTTEGTTLPSYGGGASAPNVTGVPNLTNHTVKWYQHFDVDRSSRALRNASGGVETNQLNAFQVELVGTCDPATRDEWSREGRSFIFWPDAPDWALKEVAKLVRWLDDNHKIQIKSSVSWKAYPSSYGDSPVRLSGAQWSAYYGWLGHQHVPENDHGDPGDIDFDRIIQFALGDAPTEGEDVALTSDDIKKIFETDGIISSPDYDKDPAGNLYWSAESYLRNTYLKARSTAGTVAALTAEVEAVKAKLDAVSTGGVDLDALAVKVADEIYRRMAQ